MPSIVEVSSTVVYLHSCMARGQEVIALPTLARCLAENAVHYDVALKAAVVCSLLACSLLRSVL